MTVESIGAAYTFVQVAVPDVNGTASHATVPSVSKLTVPVGERSGPVIVAVYVTVWPDTEGSADETSTVAEILSVV